MFQLLFPFQLSQTSEESTAGKAASYAQNVKLIKYAHGLCPLQIWRGYTGMQANYLQGRTGYKVVNAV